MTLIHNERTKLPANALDRASTVCLTVGVFAPIAALYSSTGTFVPVRIFVIGAAVWIFTAIVPHMSARRVLRRLR